MPWLDKTHMHEGKEYRVFQDDIGSETIYVLTPDAKRTTWCAKLIYLKKGEEPKETRKRKQKRSID